jgi:hypothetical protein
LNVASAPCSITLSSGALYQFKQQIKNCIMEMFTQDHDITVGYITAASFPDDVLGTHQRLHALVPGRDGRFYGISRPEGNGIIYRAAAEMTSAEAAALGLETLVLKKGSYLGTTVYDFMNNIPAIGTTFSNILQQPGLDPQGYCVEWYFNDRDVRCSVRLQE